MASEPTGSSGEAGPTGRRVIVTRSVDDNRSLVAELERLGVVVVEVPLVEVTAPLDDGRALAAAVGRLTAYRWVVVTSVNGVRALKQAMADRPWPPGVTVAPVGPKTETVARSVGMTVAPSPPIASAQGLVDAFGSWDGEGSNRVLAPLGDLAGPTMVDGLGAKGWAVERITAYRTEAPTGPATEPVPSADVVTFFSPSVVDRFVTRFGADAVPRSVVCIGPSTAERADRHGLANVIVASPHTEAGVVAALRRILG